MFYSNAARIRRRSDGSIQKLHADVVARRRSLLASAEVLVPAGVFDPNVLARIRKGSGYLNMAEDLSALCVLFRTHWSRVKGRTAVTQEEIEHAQRLAEELIVRQGRRMHERGRNTRRDAGDDVRDRCFTLFLRAYDECRPAAAYLRRHEGDAEHFAPNLFTKDKQGSRKKVPAKEPVEHQAGAAVGHGPADRVRKPRRRR